MQTKSIFCVSVLIGACNPQIAVDTLGTTTELIEYLCVPGESIECGCENGLEGAQKCQGDGQAFGECVCEEPSTTGDSSSTGSTSEEEIACEAGEMDACACDLETVGTKICTDSNEWGECFCSPPDVPNPPGFQWVLRNKNGDVVDALFEPSCPQESSLECSIIPHEKDLPCIFVKYLNGTPLGSYYAVTTGSALSCYSKKTDFSGYMFDNPSCEGTPYSGSPFGFTATSKFERIQDKLYWSDYTGLAQVLQQYYVKDGDSCVEQILGQYPVYPIKEVPLSVYSLFPNSPYSIYLE